MSFPISPGSVPVNVDIKLSSLLPAALTKTKTITKATAKNGDDLFCMEIDSASAAAEESDEDLMKKLPPLVEKLVCALAEKEEQPAIDAICAKVPVPECQDLLKKLFDKLLQKCQPSEEIALGKELSLSWKDCGSASTKAKITSFSPSSITLGQKTTLTGKGDLSEQVAGANFDLTMTGVTGQLLHCSGDASVTKSCNLPLGTGSLTFEGMSFPIAPGSVPVNVEIKLSSLLPSALTKTKTITKATAKNGDELFCMEIDSASANSEQDEVEEAPSDLVHFVEGGSLKLDWKDCGDASTKTKITGFTPATLVLGQKTKM